jgi:hypothetical protein
MTEPKKRVKKSTAPSRGTTSAPIPPVREGWHRLWASSHIKRGYQLVESPEPQADRSRAIRRIAGTHANGSPLIQYLLEIPQARYDQMYAVETGTEILAEKPEGETISGLDDYDFNYVDVDSYRPTRPRRFSIRLDWRGVAFHWDKYAALRWGDIKLSWFPPRLGWSFDSQEKLEARMSEGDAVLQKDFEAHYEA